MIELPSITVRKTSREFDGLIKSIVDEFKEPANRQQFYMSSDRKTDQLNYLLEKHYKNISAELIKSGLPDDSYILVFVGPPSELVHFRLKYL